MSADQRIVVASQNRGKCREIARLLGQRQGVSLAELEPIVFPEEGGDYLENARQKALVAARATGLVSVADDSGLEVECLGGAPGAFSARYGGPGLDDRGRIEHLLAALAGRPRPWHARFFCAAACALPDGRVDVAVGICEGEILETPSGAGGFGYDPVFRPAGHRVSMAELPSEVKQSLSHRGHAFRALAPRLDALRASPLRPPTR